MDHTKAIHVTIRVQCYLVAIDKKDFILLALGRTKLYGDQYDDMCFAQLKMYIEQLIDKNDPKFNEAILYKKIRSQYVIQVSFIVSDSSRFAADFDGWMKCLCFSDGFSETNQIEVIMSYMDQDRMFFPDLVIQSDHDSSITEKDG